MTLPIATQIDALDGMAAKLVVEAGAEMEVALFVNGAEVVGGGYGRQTFSTFSAATAYASNRSARVRSAQVVFAASNGAITFDQIKVYASDGVTLVAASQRSKPRTNDGPVTVTFRSTSPKIVFDVTDHDAALNGVTADTDAWEACLEATAAYQGTAFLPSATSRLAGDSAIMQTLTGLKGEGCEKSILRATSGATGAIVSSEDLDDCIADEPKWSDGNGGALTLPPMRLRVESIGFHGSGSNNDAPHENGASLDGSLTYDLTGLDVYSPGAEFRNLQFYKIEGTGLRYNHGAVGTRPSPRPYADKEEAEFSNLFFMNCLRGLWLQSGTDAILDNVIAAGCRDEGILVDAGASVFDLVHTYGNGTGVKLNNSAHFGVLQVDADMVGLHVTGSAAYTTIDKLIVQHCITTGATISGSTEIGLIRIGTIPNNATGVLFNGNGGGAIYGGRCDVTGNAAVCFDVRHWPVQITARVFGDSSKTGGDAQTALKFGLDVAPNGCVIDLYVAGCNIGLDIRSIGYGNTIRLRHRDVANPVVDSISSMDASNHITLVNVLTGAESTWSP